MKFLSDSICNPEALLNEEGSASELQLITLTAFFFYLQISQLMTETSREGLTEAALNRYNADKPSLYSFPASQSTYVAADVSTGTSVGASFFAR